MKSVETTVGAYLARVHEGAPHETEHPTLPPRYQRSVLDITSNAIKQRMLRDVLRGGVLPPLTVIDRDEGAWEIVDGLHIGENVLAVRYKKVGKNPRADVELMQLFAQPQK